MEKEYYIKGIQKIIADRENLIPLKLGIEKKEHLLYIYSNYLYSEFGMYNLNLDPSGTVDAKRNFYKLLRGNEFDYWLNMGLYPTFKEKKKDYSFWGNLVMDFDSIFLCDHEEAITYLFNEAIEFYKDLIPKSKLDNRTKAFLYLMNGEKQKAKEIFQHEYKHSDSFIRGFAHVLGGILHDDIKLVNKGIGLQINYGGDLHGPNANYHHRATGLAKVALRFGMEPNVSDSRINKKLLEFEKIDYEDIDNLYDALGIEPIVRHSLRNY